MSADKDETFLSRWSRRKRREGDDAADETKGPDTLAQPARRDREASAKVSDPLAEPEVDLATLPKIEDLTASSDFSVFLKKGVPEYLKRQALRQAWSVDPQIRDFIEVAENQYNYNIPGGVPGYGELPAGTDIQALLAQAIGQSPKPEDPPEEQVAQADAPADSDRPAARQPPKNEMAPDRAALGSCEQRAAVEDTSVEVRSDGMAPSEEKPARAQRRRHGGALPDLDGAA
jgi:Protein of unknown function (DUF3306)